MSNPFFFHVSGIHSLWCPDSPGAWVCFRVFSLCVLVNLPTSVSVLSALNYCNSLWHLHIWFFHHFPLMGWYLDFFLDIYPWTFGYLSLDFWIFVLGFLPFYRNLELIYETGITMTKTTTKPVGDLFGLLSIYRSVEKELSLFFILSSPIHEHCITIHRFVFYPCIWGKLSTFVNGSYSFSVCS